MNIEMFNVGCGSVELFLYLLYVENVVFQFLMLLGCSLTKKHTVVVLSWFKKHAAAQHLKLSLWLFFPEDL